MSRTRKSATFNLDTSRNASAGFSISIDDDIGEQLAAIATTSAKLSPATTQQKLAAGNAIFAVRCNAANVLGSNLPSCPVDTTANKSNGTRHAKCFLVPSKAAHVAGARIAPGTTTANVHGASNIVSFTTPVVIAFVCLLHCCTCRATSTVLVPAATHTRTSSR